MSNGIYKDMPAEQYFAADRLNNSGIKKLLVSPMHYQASLVEEREDTKALIIGSAVHSAVLEPHKFEAEYIAKPDGIDKRTKEGKDLFAKLESSGKTILDGKDFINVISIAESVRNHPTASRLVSGGRSEYTVFTELDDIAVKSRMDHYHASGVIVDLKTTESSSPSEFARSVAKYGYHIQAAWYLDCANAAGLEAHTFLFVTVEKKAPYAVGIYELDADSIEAGRQQYQRGIAIYKHCLATDEWPGYSEDIVSLSLPKWAFMEAA